MNSSDRIIDILMSMLLGEKIDVDSVKSLYGVSERTIKRDLSTIRSNSIFSAGHDLHYDSVQKKYSVTENGAISSEEALAIIKILTSSRALNDVELKVVVRKLLNLVATDEQADIKILLTTTNENYSAVVDNKILPLVKQFSEWIIHKREITFEYETEMTDHSIKQCGVPLSIYFDDCHFHVLMYLIDADMTVIYQLDRFKQVSDEQHSINVPANRRPDISRILREMYKLYPEKKREKSPE